MLLIQRGRAREPLALVTPYSKRYFSVRVLFDLRRWTLFVVVFSSSLSSFCCWHLVNFSRCRARRVESVLSPRRHIQLPALGDSEGCFVSRFFSPLCLCFFIFPVSTVTRSESLTIPKRFFFSRIDFLSAWRQKGDDESPWF